MNVPDRTKQVPKFIKLFAPLVDASCQPQNKCCLPPGVAGGVRAGGEGPGRLARVSRQVGLGMRGCVFVAFARGRAFVVRVREGAGVRVREGAGE